MATFKRKNYQLDRLVVSKPAFIYSLSSLIQRAKLEQISLMLVSL